jgi:hypothetical protein
VNKSALTTYLYYRRRNGSYAPLEQDVIMEQDRTETDGFVDLLFKIKS